MYKQIQIKKTNIMPKANRPTTYGITDINKLVIFKGVMVTSQMIFKGHNADLCISLLMIQKIII